MRINGYRYTISIHRQFTDNAFHDVNDLDITAVLSAASPAQNVSSSFQIRFGQQDNYWAGHDGITIDNIVVSEAPIHAIAPTILPFVEDWEAYSGQQKTDTVFYLDTYAWAFETDVQGQGRASYGTDAYMPNTGVGAITLDKAGGNGDNALTMLLLRLTWLIMFLLPTSNFLSSGPTTMTKTMVVIKYGLGAAMQMSGWNCFTLPPSLQPTMFTSLWMVLILMRLWLLLLLRKQSVNPSSFVSDRRTITGSSMMAFLMMTLLLKRIVINPLSFLI